MKEDERSRFRSVLGGLAIIICCIRQNAPTIHVFSGSAEMMPHLPWLARRTCPKAVAWSLTWRRKNVSHKVIVVFVYVLCVFCVFVQNMTFIGWHAKMCVCDIGHSYSYLRFKIMLQYIKKKKTWYTMLHDCMIAWYWDIWWDMVPVLKTCKNIYNNTYIIYIL